MTEHENRVQVLRLRRGWSQVELASAAGISQGWLSQIESGAAAPDLEGALALARALGEPLEAVFPKHASRATAQVLEHLKETRTTEGRP